MDGEHRPRIAAGDCRRRRPRPRPRREAARDPHLRPASPLDTNVAVAFLVSDHTEHDLVFEALADRDLGLSGHAAFETFSVLTRLPGASRLSAATAVEHGLPLAIRDLRALGTYRQLDFEIELLLQRRTPGRPAAPHGEAGPDWVRVQVASKAATPASSGMVCSTPCTVPNARSAETIVEAPSSRATATRTASKQPISECRRHSSRPARR